MIGKFYQLKANFPLANRSMGGGEGFVCTRMCMCMWGNVLASGERGFQE